MNSVTATALGLPALLAVGVAALIALGGPKDPRPLESIQASVAARDRSRLPPSVAWQARDGMSMAYRYYPVAPAVQSVQRVAVLFHGSVGSSVEMHEVATALSAAGWSCVVPDLRGHGGSGVRGDIAYVGQLEDDFVDLVALLDRRFPLARRVLVGHSAGGGFALRVGAIAAANGFDSLVLLAPFLAVEAPTSRPQGRWASVGLGRLLGLQAVGTLGIHAFDHLPVLSFAVAPEVSASLTPRYSYRLMQNFGPHSDWRGDISHLSVRTTVLAGGRDELFYADRFQDLFASKAQVRVLDDIDHMGITGEPMALRSIVAAVDPSVASGTSGPGTHGAAQVGSRPN